MATSASSQAQDGGSTAGAGALPPPVIGGEELYDMIMAEIEPELTTEGMKLLPEKYANETPAQAEKRAVRYKEAFAEYDVRYAAHNAAWQGAFGDYQRQALASFEGVDKAVDEEQMTDLLQKMDNA